MSEYTRQATTRVSLPWLVDMAENGQLRPAAFSRPQVWDRLQVADLFDSIFHGYPIGTLLVIGRSVPEESYLLGDLHVTAPLSDHSLVIVDGLQRIIAISSTLSRTRSEYEDDRFRVFFDPKDETFEAEMPVYLALLPLYVAADRSLLTRWLEEHPDQSAGEIGSCWRLFEALATYSVPMVTLEGNNALETAGVVFTRLNAGGASLTKFDLARARATRENVPKRGLEQLQIEAERLAFGHLPADQAAECAIAVLSRTDVASHSSPALAPAGRVFDQLPEQVRERAVTQARKVIDPAIQFLQQEALIPHIKLLPQSNALSSMIKFIDDYGPPQGRTRELLRRWVWRCGTVLADPVPRSHDSGDRNEDALSATISLLESLPSAPGRAWRPDSYALSLAQADGRLNALGLLHQRPPLLVAEDSLNDSWEANESSDVPVSAPFILVPWLDNADSVFCQFLPVKVTRGRRRSLGSSLLHPPADRDDLWDAVISEVSRPAGRLAAHSIDETSARFLSLGEFDQFIARRERQMISAIQHQVQSRARWGFRDYGSLPSIAHSGYGDEYRDEY